MFVTMGVCESVGVGMFVSVDVCDYGFSIFRSLLFFKISWNIPVLM